MRKALVVIAIVFVGACGKTKEDRERVASKVAEELRVTDSGVEVEAADIGGKELRIFSDACGWLRPRIDVFPIRKAGFRLITCNVRNWGRPIWTMQP